LTLDDGALAFQQQLVLRPDALNEVNRGQDRRQRVPDLVRQYGEEAVLLCVGLQERRVFLLEPRFGGDARRLGFREALVDGRADAAVEHVEGTMARRRHIVDRVLPRGRSRVFVDRVQQHLAEEVHLVDDLGDGVRVGAALVSVVPAFALRLLRRLVGQRCGDELQERRQMVVELGADEAVPARGLRRILSHQRPPAIEQRLGMVDEIGSEGSELHANSTSPRAANRHLAATELATRLGITRVADALRRRRPASRAPRTTAPAHARRVRRTR
jgi:hypothetical protein